MGCLISQVMLLKETVGMFKATLNTWQSRQSTEGECGLGKVTELMTCHLDILNWLLPVEGLPITTHALITLMPLLEGRGLSVYLFLSLMTQEILFKCLCH